jgi:hypothetical protein
MFCRPVIVNSMAANLRTFRTLWGAGVSYRFSSVEEFVITVWTELEPAC